MSAERVTLAEMATYLNGYPFKPADMRPSGVPIVRIKQFLNPDAETDYSDFKLDPRYCLRSGDVVFSWSATLACAEWSRGVAYLNQHLFKVVPNEGYLPRFVMYAIQASLPELRELAHGSTMTHIRVGDLSKVLVPARGLEEQRRIVDLLSSADRVVGALAAESEAAEACREALVVDLLAGVSNRVPIGGLLTERTDTITVDDSVLYTQVTVAGKGRGMRLREQKLGRDIGTKKQMVLAADELVVSRIDARKGAACVVPGEFSGAIVTSSFPCFRIATAICTPEYLDLIVRSREFARACDAISAGTTNRVSVDMGRFGGVLVPLPTIAEQHRIMGAVSTVDGRVDAARQRLQSANTLRDQLLHDLLSGSHTIPASYDRFLAGVSS